MSGDDSWEPGLVLGRGCVWEKVGGALDLVPEFFLDLGRSGTRSNVKGHAASSAAVNAGAVRTVGASFRN